MAEVLLCSSKTESLRDREYALSLTTAFGGDGDDDSRTREKAKPTGKGGVAREETSLELGLGIDDLRRGRERLLRICSPSLDATCGEAWLILKAAARKDEGGSCEGILNGHEQDTKQ